MQRADTLGRSLCLLTGASRGFGRSLALQLSERLSAGSVLLLVARSSERLRDVRDALLLRAPRLRVVCVGADLSRPEGVTETVRTITEVAGAEDVQRLLLIHNAASLGDVSRFARSFTEPAEVNDYLFLNVSAVLSLTASVLSVFPARPGLQRCVVNISSLCAQQPFPSWVLYCTGKAARDMMFRVLAEEEPQLRVLSYAPGPLDTEMLAQARAQTADQKIRKSISEMHLHGQVLSCEESAEKLLRLLLEDKYQSGAHLDFYEV